MKKLNKLSVLFIFFILSNNVAAQSWSTSGNSLSGGEKIGSTNSNPFTIITNNIQRLIINSNGTVGIGTSASDADFKLSVEGKIRAREIVVNGDTWADYVFDDYYHLMSLYDLDNYIQTNRHLPGMPTTEEVKKNGYSVSKMNVLLLEKVEELTLHTISLNKRIDELEKRLQALEATK